MKKFLLAVFCAIVVDAFFWDFILRVFPIANSKMILAVLGVIAFGIQCVKEHTFSLSRRVLFSAFLALLFSIWCFIAITINGTNDKTYVTYFISFVTWIAGAYGAITLLRMVHDRIDLMLITRYLAIICVAQCIIALLIDNVPAVESLVKRLFLQGYDFYERDNRLYGIGCALDPAGIRFSAVLVLIAHQLALESRVRGNLVKSGTLFLAFTIITVIGCMIARTTMVGAVLGLVFIAWGSFKVEIGGFISRLQVGFSLLLFLLIGAAVGISIYLYNASDVFHDNFRFGFEGFFNWVETGEFRTHSTDILMDTMWIWPEDSQGWLIGYGRYGLFEWNTDIGYCNFVLYCGIIGLTIFSIYFIFNHLSLISKFHRFAFTALLLTAITFIVWAKVATDIFLVDALLFCIDPDPESRDGRLLSAATSATS